MLHKSMGFRMFVLFLENLIFTAECSMVTGTLPKRIGKFEEDMYKEPQTVYKIWGIRETAKHTGAARQKA